MPKSSSSDEESEENEEESEEESEELQSETFDDSESGAETQDRFSENQSQASFSKIKRSKTPYFPGFVQSEPEGLDLIREISKDLDVISAQLSFFVPTSKPFKIPSLPPMLPQPTKRVLQSEKLNLPIKTTTEIYFPFKKS